MSRQPNDDNGRPWPVIIQGTVENLAFDGHAESAVFDTNTTLVRLCASEDCYILISGAGTAATSSNGSLLMAGAIEFWSVPKGGKVSAIKKTNAGILSITQAK